MTITFTTEEIDMIRGAITGSIVNWEARGHYDIAANAKDLLRKLDGMAPVAD